VAQLGTVSGLLLAIVGGLAIRHSSWWPAALAVVSGFIAALLISTLSWQSAAHNPLVAAAAHGSWARVEMTVSSPARQLANPFPARSTSFPSATSQSAVSVMPAVDPLAAASIQYLLRARATHAEIAGLEFDPALEITVMAIGSQWSRLVPGEHIVVGGILATGTYSVLPGVLMKAKGAARTEMAAPWWQLIAASIRVQLLESAAGLSVDAKGLLPGLVIGDTDAISAQLLMDAKLTGLTHLLAVSGSHFALLCGLVVLVLRRAGPRIAAGAGAIVLLGLVVLVGTGASVMRAAVMGAITLLALLMGRHRTALPALATATILLLFHDPTLGRSVGFALSVMATAGLILIAPVWSKSLQRKGLPAGWADLLAVPAAAFVATMPIIVALSGAISLASVPANLLAALVVGPALVIGMASALTGPWWPALGRGLAKADQPLLEWIAFIAHRLARWQVTSVPWPAGVSGALVLTPLLILTLLAMRHRRFRAVVIAVIVGAGVILVPARWVTIGWPPAGWLVVGCEVGQGLAVVLNTGDPGTALVLDTGPDPILVNACLRRLNIVTVPLVVLTHLHADHADGLAGVLDGRTVGAIGVGPDRDAVQAWRTVNQLAAARGIPVVDLSPGVHWGSGQLEFDVLGPLGPFRGTDSDENNDSLVLMARTNGIRILLTGDIEYEAQQQLLNQHLDLRAEVLQQPHHGSAKVLPAFTAAVAPMVSVIGVGLGNGYGQPSPKILSQLGAIGSVVLRTDIAGDSAVVLVDGQLSTVSSGATLPPGSGKSSGSAEG